MTKEIITILVMGQSNAVGSSNAPTGYIYTSRGIPNGITIFDYYRREFKIPVYGENPLNKSGSTNLGIEAAKEILKYTDAEFRIIVSAIGGISINRWVSEDTVNMIDGELRSVKKQLEASGVEHVDAIIWSQGEADQEMEYQEYVDKHNIMLDRLYGLKQISEETPFVAIGLGTWETHKRNRHNLYLMNLSTNSDKRTSNVPIFGTVKNPFVGQDRHFDHRSMVLLGRRVGHEIMKRLGIR